MEILIDSIDFLLFVGLIISPIFLLRQINNTKIKFKFITYLTLGIILTAIVVFAFAWWIDTSNLILLKHYGYNIDGMNETEFYGNVLPENMDKVNSLVTSIMGIGWPLKAIFTFVFFLPYLLIVYFIFHLIGKNKINKLKVQQDS